MRITSIPGWLLVALLLAGCARAVEPPAAGTGAEIATARVAVSTTAHATAAPTSQPRPAIPPATPPALNDGGVTNDEPTLPGATVATATASTPSPTDQASDAPAATTAPIVIATAPTATPAAAIRSTDPHPLQIEVMRQQSYQAARSPLSRPWTRGLTTAGTSFPTDLTVTKSMR